MPQSVVVREITLETMRFSGIGTVMDWIQLIGAVGVGAIVTKLLDVLWLQRLIQRNEFQRWLREQRLKVYANLTKELLSEGVWHGDIDIRDALKLAAESVLLTNDNQLAKMIDDYFSDVPNARKRLDQFINNGTSTIEERVEMREKEELRLREKARQIVSELRLALLHL